MDYKLNTYNRNTHIWESIGTDVFFDQKGNRFTPEQLAQTINNIFANISTINFNLNELADNVGEITDFKQLGESLVEKIVNEFKQRAVNVTWYGAKGDGKTDDIVAFEKAIATGMPVYVPPGHYRFSRGIKLPSKSAFLGAGKDLSILTWLDNVGRGESLVSNKNVNGGDESIVIDGFTIDGNARRMNDPDMAGSGGSRDSALTIRGAKNVSITRIKTLDTLLHGIDVTCGGLDYPYLGDGTTAPNRSSNVYISQCDTSGFGDDGITTHHSDFIVIENNYSHDARRRSNCNGIEIDDGSQHVLLVNNQTARCYGGVEIKAHANAPASKNVIVNGHISNEDVRAYNFRHIGHHTASDPTSVSARNITASNITAINPNNSRGFQGGTSPRVVAISAYVGVNINGVTAIHTNPDQYVDIPIIAIQYKARNVNIDNASFTGFTKASIGVYVTGGAQKADNVNISNVTSNDSARTVVYVGKQINNVNISNITGIAGKVVNPEAVVKSINSKINIHSIRGEGYPALQDIAGDKYAGGLTMFQGGFRASSSSSGKIHTEGAVISSTSSSSAEASKSAVVASSNSHAKAERSAVIASAASTVTGNYGVVIGSLNSTATNRNNAVIGSSASDATGNRSSILSSWGVLSDGSYKVNGGYGEPTSAGRGRTANKKWELDGLSGNIKATGNISGSSTFADYAEYFESFDGQKISTGTLVTLAGDKVKPANKGDKIIGAISETAGVILGEASFSWQDRYLKNEFGGYIYEYREIPVEVFDEVGNVIDIKYVKEKMPVKNPEYNPDKKYTSRSDRDEWNIVGLMGQIYVRTGEELEVGQGISSDNGYAFKGDFGIVMSVTTPYDKKKGYGVAKVLIK